VVVYAIADFELEDRHGLGETVGEVHFTHAEADAELAEMLADEPTWFDPATCGRGRAGWRAVRRLAELSQRSARGYPPLYESNGGASPALAAIGGTGRRSPVMLSFDMLPAPAPAGE